MSKQLRILSLHWGLNSLVSRYGSVYNDPQILDQSDAVDLVVFPGGPDVPPSAYGESAHPKTHYSQERYDTFEAVYNAGKAKGAKFLGICGGAQYLCVKAGGKLIQHVDNHGIWNTHPVKSVIGDVLVNSTHHQVMLPGNTKHELLAWAENLSHTHQDGNQNEIDVDKEAEAVYFPEINALSVQWHPENMPDTTSGNQLFHHLVQKYLL